MLYQQQTTPISQGIFSLEDTSVLPYQTAIYYIINKAKREILYIGKTISLYHRFNDEEIHHALFKILEDGYALEELELRCDLYNYVVSNRKLLDREAELIKLHNPEYNVKVGEIYLSKGTLHIGQLNQYKLQKLIDNTPLTTGQFITQLIGFAYQQEFLSYPAYSSFNQGIEDVMYNLLHTINNLSVLDTVDKSSIFALYVLSKKLQTALNGLADHLYSHLEADNIEDKLIPIGNQIGQIKKSVTKRITLDEETDTRIEDIPEKYTKRSLKSKKELIEAGLDPDNLPEGFVWKESVTYRTSLK